MLNIEKYKNFVMNNLNWCQIETDVRKAGGKATIDCAHTLCEDCKESYFKWLLEEYKEPILDDKEKEYLSAVLRPFGKNACTVCKKYIQSCSGLSYEYLVVKLSNERWGFPKFVEGTMYKGMETGKEYTLEELGL